MGEYADMMIDGTCCQVCGVFIGPGDGFPRCCSGCGDPETRNVVPKRAVSKPFPCRECSKRFTQIGFSRPVGEAGF